MTGDSGRTEAAKMAERNRLLSVLLHVSNLSAVDADPRTLGEAVLERLHGLLFCDASLCYLIAGKRLVHGPERTAARFRGSPCPATAHDAVQQRFSEQSANRFASPICSRISRRMSRFRERLALFLDGPGSVARCWMFLPMVLRGRTVGLIAVAHHEPGQFDADDRVFGAAFAHQAAIEFENARLARDARMRTDEVRTMLEAQQVIARRGSGRGASADRR